MQETPKTWRKGQREWARKTHASRQHTVRRGVIFFQGPRVVVVPAVACTVVRASIAVIRSRVASVRSPVSMRGTPICNATFFIGRRAEPLNVPGLPRPSMPFLV